jgi:hypothetical protein
MSTVRELREETSKRMTPYMTKLKESIADVSDLSSELFTAVRDFDDHITNESAVALGDVVKVGDTKSMQAGGLLDDNDDEGGDFTEGVAEHLMSVAMDAEAISLLAMKTKIGAFRNLDNFAQAVAEARRIDHVHRKLERANTKRSLAAIRPYTDKVNEWIQMNKRGTTEDTEADAEADEEEEEEVVVLKHAKHKHAKGVRFR